MGRRDRAGHVGSLSDSFVPLMSACEGRGSDALDIAVGRQQQLVTRREVDLDEFQLLTWVDGADAVAADFSERDEAARDRHGGGVVHRAVNRLLAFGDDRSLHQHLAVASAFGGFNALHDLDGFLKFRHDNE